MKSPYKSKKKARAQSCHLTGEARSLAAPVQPLSTGRKILFSIVGFVLLPLLFLVVVEIGLRVTGYGYSPGFFKPLRIGNEDYLVENDKFGLRFFPPELARSPAPIVLKAHKPSGTFRIFVLGESAALGDPRPAYGAARYLQVLLRERYPATEFEVVCAAVTAINSHAVLPIARECARQGGDLWIIYMGNNEMVGPFGTATVFGSRSARRSYVGLVLGIQKTRLGQLLMTAGRKLAGSTPHGPSWGGMQMFLQNRTAPRDPRKEVVYDNFRRNLEGILRTGQAAGAPIILNTVAANLKDSPPFASLAGTNLSSMDQAAWEKMLAVGTQAEAEGDYTTAAKMYTGAANLTPEHAELQFRLAGSLLHQGNLKAAHEHFRRACDDDALPFRADSRLNRIIDEVGRQEFRRDVVLCDTPALFAANSPSGVPGREAFYEHVHFNFDGNYRLARTWAELVQAFLPAGVTNRAGGAWASQEVCERRLGLSDWNRYGVLEDVTRRLAQAPFTNQLHSAGRMKTLRADLTALRDRMNASAAVDARQVYVEALQRFPRDHRLHENFAEFLEARGELEAAAAEWERVRELIPHHHAAWFYAGRLYARQGRADEAERRLAQSLRLRPDMGEGWLELGRLHAVKGNYGLALTEYERAGRLMPDDYLVHYFRGKALSQLSRHEEAIASFRRALELRPSHWETRYALGEELAFDGKTAEARREFEEVIRQKPAYAMAHLNLGVALWQEGRKQEALSHFEECCRLDPENKTARNYLEKLKGNTN